MDIKRWLVILAALISVPLVFCLVAFSPMLGWFLFRGESWEERRPVFERAAERGMLVVDAIQRFEADHGHSPESLAGLAPTYLPDMPTTGLPDYPEYEYEVFDDSKSTLVWYDLGSREGRPMSGLWVLIDGDPEHAILGLTLNEDERVTEARVDRMPADHLEIEFDAARWARRESRIEMARAVPRHVSLQNAKLSDVQEELGEPDGRRVLRDSPWELRVNCFWGLSADVFLYWPTQAYPEYIYGGGTEVIGQWCYVHE